jgi:hypothetical protein
MPQESASVAKTVTTAGHELSWTQTIFEVIDMRSFSNLWYWIALAVAWSKACHWVLGVPYDMIQRAQRQGGQVQHDLEELVRINIGRLLYIARLTGLWALGFVSAALTALGTLAFYYEVEFAQAVFLLALPMSIVGALSLSTARLIEETQPTGKDLHKRLYRQRLYTQIIGMNSIFVTSMYGMWQNMASTPGF